MPPYICLEPLSSDSCFPLFVVGKVLFWILVIGALHLFRTLKFMLSVFLLGAKLIQF